MVGLETQYGIARVIICWQVVSLEQVVNSLRQENALLNRGMFKLVSNLQEEKQKLAEVRICLLLNTVSKEGGGGVIWFLRKECRIF
jgi:hypothetical protein